MAERTRYDRFRRGAALVAFVGAIVLLVRQGCGGDSATTTIELRLGDAAPEVRSLRADLFDGSGTPVAYFEREYPVGGVTLTPKFPVTAKPGDYRLEVILGRESGPTRITRPVEVTDGATVTVFLDSERPAAPPAEAPPAAPATPPS